MKRNFFMKPTRFLTKFFLFVFFVLLGYVVIAQTILIPRTISVQYNQHLKPDFKQLSAKFNAVSKSTELDAYNDPFSNVATGRKDLLATQTLINQTEKSLGDYEQEANTLPSSILAPRTEDYKKAQIVRARAKDIFLQSHEVLRGYKQLTNYLLQVNSARTVLQNNTADINGLTDLNRLAGQGDIIAGRAVQLGGAITTLKQAQPPPGFSDYNNTLIANFQQAESGLSELSQGLNATDDSRINGGESAIQGAIRNIENQGASLFTTASTNSALLSQAGQIADKVDSLQPFLSQ